MDERRRAVRVTRPDRRFDADDLAALPRAERRKLAQVLLIDTGARIVEFQTTAAHDELVLELPVLWRTRRVRVRIADRIVDGPSLVRLDEAVRAGGDAEGVMIAACGVDGAASVPLSIALVTPQQFIARMERTASIAWVDRVPSASTAQVALQRDLDRDAYLLDPVGLRWLPSLALQELPVDVSSDVPAEDLFERVAFRLLTSSLRFDGQRFGERARGQRLPDAVLRWPHREPVAALLDCKATSAGYSMQADHLLRFTHYAQTLRPDLEAAGHDLRYMLILSSSFPGDAGDRHPFHARAASLLESSGMQLVYVRAQDLARTATMIEARGLSTDERARLDWPAVFDHGLVVEDHLNTMLGS